MIEKNSIVYEASDGKEFLDKKECQDYELRLGWTNLFISMENTIGLVEATPSDLADHLIKNRSEVAKLFRGIK